MKCVSIDLDGTLLNSHHEISEENTLALNKLQEKGYETILNTGRAYADIVKIKTIQNMDVSIFCLNGTVFILKNKGIVI